MTESQDSTKGRRDSINWHDVPELALKAWNRIFLESRESTDLSTPCPVCGARELHRWYYCRKPVDIVLQERRYRARGSGWQWCSRCRSYIHFSGLVPEWWYSDVDLPLSVLLHHPQPIEDELKRRRGGNGSRSGG